MRVYMIDLPPPKVVEERQVDLNSYLLRLSKRFEFEILPLFTQVQLKAHDDPHHRWNEIVRRKIALREGRVAIFGYGSLVNIDSAQTPRLNPTLGISSEAISTRRASVTFGFKRLFNYVSNQNEIPLEKSMLNVTYAEATVPLNGVLYDVNHEDFIKLCIREKGYDLISIPCVSWNSVLTQEADPKIEWAYLFICQDPNHLLHPNRPHLPIKRYVEVVFEGANSLDPAFLSLFKNSTYRTDGRRLFPWQGS